MTLPKEATCVFKGKIHDVYQWRQQMFDGSYETFERIKRPDSVQIIATKDNQILISKEEQPSRGMFYSLLGGRMEHGEDVLVSAQRELLEETGYESDDWEIIKTFDSVSGVEMRIFLLVARNCKKLREPQLDAGEKIEVLELGFDEFIAMVKSEQFRSKFLTLDIYRLQETPQLLGEFKSKIFGQ